MSDKKYWDGWKRTRLTVIVLLLVLIGHLVVAHWNFPEWWCKGGNWLTFLFLLLLFVGGLICVERARFKVLENEKKKFLGLFKVDPLIPKLQNIWLAAGVALLLTAGALSLGFIPTICDTSFVSAGQYFMILFGRIYKYKDLIGGNPPIGLSILSAIMWLIEGAIMGLIVTIVVNAIGIAKKE